MQSVFSIDKLSYTQNNLPRQGEAKSSLSSIAYVINADLIYGRVVSDQVIYAQLLNDSGTNVDQQNIRYRTQDRVGFRVGAGISLGKNNANLSLQYSWLRSKKTENRNVSNQYLVVFNADGNTINLPQLDTKLTAQTFIRMQTLDLVVQTALFMMSEKTRFQPVIGVRYLPFHRQLLAKAFQQDLLKAKSLQRFKLWGTGPFIGTDIKFIFSQNFHFFANLMLGILAGNESFFSSVVNNVVPQAFDGTTDVKFLLNPFFEMRFGLAFSQLVNNSWLFSFRLAYEMFSMIADDARVVVPVTAEDMLSLTAIKKQAGVFGMTVVF